MDNDIEKILDRFYRVDKARSRSEGSHGLGLAIAKAIVDRRSGKLSCESDVGVKGTFILKLKIEKDLRFSICLS